LNETFTKEPYYPVRFLGFTLVVAIYLVLVHPDSTLTI